MMPIWIMMLITFLVLLVMNIRRIIKEKSRARIAGTAVLLLLVVVITVFPFRQAKLKAELCLYDAKRSEVVEMIRAGSLQPVDNIGNVVLPLGYRRVSATGEVFEYQNDENGQVIGFWIFRGMLSGSIELVYSSGGEALIRANDTGHFITKIEMLKEHWYYVETD